MTLTDSSADLIPRTEADDALPLAVEARVHRTPPGAAGPDRRYGLIAVLGVIAVVLAFFIVIYGIGPLTHQRDQRTLMATETAAISNAVTDNQGLSTNKLPTQPPVPGQALGILAIPAIGLQQVVVEGVGPSQTVSGPGHVPGTAGLGQPGNSAVVGRHSSYGGPFADISQLRPGDRIVTATTEGQSLYVVHSVRMVTLSATGGSVKSGKVSVDQLYGPSVHDQLTLVTSASSVPWNSHQAWEVVARIKGQPYPPTPQESRSPSQQGNTGDPSNLAALVLALLALGAVLIGAVALYRRTSVRSAYLLSMAPLLVCTVLAAEAISRLLPAWS
jgi:sortase A